MSAKEYVEAFVKMTDLEKEIMFDLYMTGINRDGHVWVTFHDVERAVGLIILGRHKMAEEKTHDNK